ncbi:Multimodular transpeptidase-transglycosylase / Penicillin-binding protein 1A/1B (PBP1) [Marinilactibacillus psychrotolerans 42ea]|uniref:Multimodular transpeptidase-transglycosylase / Penicillin-binding protein 1A/1B (PBP1) n=1 Tax=Marinilactibacillus psychrotolerans 42ea TaxID=1255609 RepID=A0A1R4KF64_9LACT|nr:transglycosylase domain-containing protein [Marinilactibacillus psychrotolerans]SJN42971.1 Multimodular transpeptidase-transglycosylase / Penicillin-binding protein 1A/1B (PBP1) [Marinilactibacillus psychrotolerans 42ea]
MSNNNMSRIKNKQQRKPKKNKEKKKKSWVKRIFLTLIGLFFLALVAGGGLFTYYASSAPELTEKELLGSIPTDLVDPKGDVFYTLGGENRDFAEAGEYPEIMKEAMTAIEDQNFYKHFGIDPIGIGRAALGYVTNLGKISGGGSTITQQLVKLSVFSTERSDQTLKRKAQEAWLAIQLERKLSKEQILTYYMNKINMSGNVYGIATAAEEFYGKPVEELELQEAALFAGMAQAPNRYNPYVNPEEATNRRNTVLNVMRDNGDITVEEAEKAKAIPIEEGLVNRSDSSLNSQMFDSYLVKVLEEVEEKTGLNPATAGLTIQTNIDMDAQQAAFDIANSEEYVNFPDDELQTAISLVDANTGQVKALVGGRKQEGQLLTNRATSTDRPTGSTIKPLTTYGPAIEYNKFSTYHQLVDEKWSYPDGTPLRNYDGKYVGQLSLREALVDSRNIPTARLFAEEVDRADATEFVENVGLDTNLMSKEGGLVNSNAISGTASPLQMASAYSAFSNGGNYTEPYTVSKVITQDGQEIDLTPKTHQAMSDYTAYMITDMLKDVAANYSSSVGIPGVPQAGKTGTTNYTPEQIQEHNLPSDAVPDSWYVGYTSNYSLSVWTGYDKKYEDGHWLSNKDGTRQLPRDIYQALMSKVSEGLDNSDWTKPASVSEVRVEAGSNPAKLPGPNTPESEIVTELFVAGTEPSEVSTSYGEDLTAPTGLSAQYDEDSNEININWNEYTLQDEKATYVLSVNGKEVSVEGTEYTVADPDSGTVQITLSVQAYGNTGPAATTSVTVPEPVEEEPEENTEEEPEANPEEPVEEDTGENDEDVEDKPDDPEEDSNDPNNPEDTEDNPSDESDDNSSTPPADNPGTNTNPETEE